MGICLLCLCLSFPSVMSVNCSLVDTCWEKGWPRGSLVCGIFLCFCHFVIYCPGLGVVLDWVDS